MREVPAEASKELANEFLSNLKTALGKKRVKFDLKLIRRHAQLYRFYVKSKTHFLFIHAKHGKEFFETRNIIRKAKKGKILEAGMIRD